MAAEDANDLRTAPLAVIERSQGFLHVLRAFCSIVGGEIRDVGSDLYMLADFLLIAAEDEEVTLAEQRVALARLWDLGKKLAAVADLEMPEFVEPEE